MRPILRHVLRSLRAARFVDITVILWSLVLLGGTSQALAQAPHDGPPVAQPSPSSPEALPSARPAASEPSPSSPKPAHARVPEVPLPDGAAARSRGTPRRTITGFLRASSEGDFVRAADYLDLRAIPRERRLRDGPELAAMLYRVVTWRVVVDPEQLPDEREVESARVALDTVEVDGEPADISLVRVRVGADDVWLFSRETVATIRTLYEANQRRWLEDYVPAFLKRGTLGGVAPWQWLGLAALLALAYVAARILGAGATAILLRSTKRSAKWVSELIRGTSRPVRLALTVLWFDWLEPYLSLPRKVSLLASYGETTLSILAVAWLLIALLRIGTTTYEASLPDDTAGHVENRGLRTRLAMVRRIGAVLIGIVASGVFLLQFDVVRTVGLSLLASAGIAGVLVGFAAQRTLGGIISGIEMSITQPLRIGDIVVIDGEWGTVERMFFTYIVLRLYDDRRLIVPVSRVTASPFENWTRMGSEVLTPVEIFVDYATPLDALREEFKRLCEASPLWDRRASEMFVVDATDKALRIRGLASVDNASKAFDLKCELREGLVRFLQAHEGGVYLPRGRVESIPTGSSPSTGVPLATVSAANASVASSAASISASVARSESSPPSVRSKP